MKVKNQLVAISRGLRKASWPQKDMLVFTTCCVICEPPLWSSGQSSWLQIMRSRVRFPALPDLLRSSGSGTGSTQPHEDN
jgi:hypothetical protein